MAVGVATPYSVRAETDEEICRRWGASPGTPAFFECRATLDRQRSGASPAQAAPAPVREVIGEGLALDICDKQARSSSRYPILNRATTRVAGDFEKRVYITYKIEKPGTSLAFANVECVLHGRRLIDTTPLGF